MENLTNRKRSPRVVLILYLAFGLMWVATPDLDARQRSASRVSRSSSRVARPSQSRSVSRSSRSSSPSRISPSRPSRVKPSRSVQRPSRPSRSSLSRSSTRSSSSGVQNQRPSRRSSRTIARPTPPSVKPSPSRISTSKSRKSAIPQNRSWSDMASRSGRLLTNHSTIDRSRTSQDRQDIRSSRSSRDYDAGQRPRSTAKPSVLSRYQRTAASHSNHNTKKHYPKKNYHYGGHGKKSYHKKHYKKHRDSHVSFYFGTSYPYYYGYPGSGYCGTSSVSIYSPVVTSGSYEVVYDTIPANRTISTSRIIVDDESCVGDVVMEEAVTYNYVKISSGPPVYYSSWNFWPSPYVRHRTHYHWSRFHSWCRNDYWPSTFYGRLFLRFDF